MNQHLKIRKIVDLSILLAIGVILNIIENYIGLMPLLPGVKLGIANTVGLLTLALYGPIEFVLVGLLRVVLAGTFSGFGMNFLLSLTGFLLSSVVVLLLYFTNKFSIYALSFTSAVFHGVGQVILITIIYQNAMMLYYVYIMIFSGLVTGFVIGALSKMILLKIRRPLEVDSDE
jgi:heptaprenyl diphosphate synthase